MVMNLSGGNRGPFQISNRAMVVYVAPVGTPCPEPDEQPPAPWAMVGKRNMMSSDGLTITSETEREDIEGALTTGILKSLIVKHTMQFEFSVMDFRLEVLSLAMEGHVVQQFPASSSSPGKVRIKSYIKPEPQYLAVLVRGYSPYSAEGCIQFWVPKADQRGNLNATANKGVAALVPLQFMAMMWEDAATDDDYYGWIEAYVAPRT